MDGLINFVEGQTTDKHTYHSGISGFTTSFLAILVCQIGDRTFFLAMIMAMRYNKFVVFFGAYGALAIMTILSAGFGQAITALLSPFITNILVTILFFFFGIKMIIESRKVNDEEQNQELKEVQIQLKQMQQNYIGGNKQKNVEVNDTQMQESSQAQIKHQQDFKFPKKFIFGKAFIMTFLAQWGDRSQLATIALASSYNVFLVTLGACLGHFLCTAGAVQIGNLISNKIKLSTILLVGGIVFILSGVTTLLLLF